MLNKYILVYLAVGVVLAFIRVGYLRRYDLKSYEFAYERAKQRSKVLYLTIFFWPVWVVRRCLSWISQRL